MGHKTFRDDSGKSWHEPLRQSEADAIWAAVEADKARREREMPTLQDCLRVLGDLHSRLADFGWRDAIYCPKDGSLFDVIEFGSTGIHTCHYEGEWPTGSWWVHDAGDFYPSRPVMFREHPAQAIEARSDETAQQARPVRAKARSEGCAKRTEVRPPYSMGGNYGV